MLGMAILTIVVSSTTRKAQRQSTPNAAHRLTPISGLASARGCLATNSSVSLAALTRTARSIPFLQPRARIGRDAAESQSLLDRRVRHRGDPPNRPPISSAEQTAGGCLGLCCAAVKGSWERSATIRREAGRGD